MRINAVMIFSLMLAGCDRSSDPVYASGVHKFWSHTSDPLGNAYSPPEKISWAVDPGSCGDRKAELEHGLLAAQSFWSAASGVPIHPALENEKINFVMYCSEFGKFDGGRPRAYRVKSIESDSTTSITKLSVEVPSDWKLIDEKSTDDFTPKSYNVVGVGVNTLGIMLGIKHDYDPGRSSTLPDLDESINYHKCIKNCN